MTLLQCEHYIVKYEVLQVYLSNPTPVSRLDRTLHNPPPSPCDNRLALRIQRFGKPVHVSEMLSIVRGTAYQWCTPHLYSEWNQHVEPPDGGSRMKGGDCIQNSRLNNNLCKLLAENDPEQGIGVLRGQQNVFLRHKEPSRVRNVGVGRGCGGRLYIKCSSAARWMLAWSRCLSGNACHGSENNDDKESDNIFGPPGNAYTSLVFDLEFPDISAARRAHIKFKIYSISFTKHLPSSPRKSDLRFGCPGNAFTSPVFVLQFPDISAARRAHFKIKLSFVDIGQLTQVDGVKEEARKARRRRRCSRQVHRFCDKFYILHLIHQTPSLPPSQFRLDIRSVFVAQFPDISAARRAQFKIKLSFVDIGQLTQVDGVKEEARKARRRRRCSRQV
ncbi:hypothetical protein B0H34DRAFT_822619 [Crassisporium funariophilum]|nr:hypothetical protein B0H34DRAFT_822619 [Crassisporium funariophilum]